jgi:hypothetical protein
MAESWRGDKKGRPKKGQKPHSLQESKKKGRELIPLVVSIVKMQVWVEMASLFVIDAQHNHRGKNL